MEWTGPEWIGKAVSDLIGRERIGKDGSRQEQIGAERPYRIGVERIGRDRIRSERIGWRGITLTLVWSEL